MRGNRIMRKIFSRIKIKIVEVLKNLLLLMKNYFFYFLSYIKHMVSSIKNHMIIISFQLKRFSIWMVRWMLKFVKGLLRLLPIILFICLTVFFIIFLIALIYYERMAEFDTALKYLLIPVYVFSALITGRLAKDNIKKQLVIFLKREPESRWASNEEIMNIKDIKCVRRNSATYDYAGIPFIVKGSAIYVDEGEAHSLIIGSTGSGKTRRLVLPLINLLARKGESIVITDPKGELFKYSRTILTKLGYKIICVNFREPSCGNAWNPLGIPYEYYKSGNKDKAMELLYDLGLNICFDKNSSSNKEPFWENSAADYFSGLALALFEKAEKDEINLNSIIHMNAVGYERLGVSNYLKEFFNCFEKTHVAYTSVSGTINAPNDTRGGIISTFQQKLSVYCNQVELSKMLSTSDFKMSHIGVEKTAVFVIMHDEKSSYHPLVSAFIKQCYEELIGTAHINGGSLPIRVNLVLDEFANLPPITDMSNMITAARSRKIRINLIIQGSQQLAAHYGKETAEVIKGNCTNWFFLTSKELPLLKEISELCGQTFGQHIINEAKERPLVSVAQLQRFQIGEVLIKRDRQYPFKTYLPDISEYAEWNIGDDKVCESVSVDRPSISIFDLKEYVQKEKRNKDLEHNRDKNEEDIKSQAVNENFTNINMNEHLSSSDIDKMIADIDIKLKELDEQEEKIVEERRAREEKRTREKGNINLSNKSKQKEGERKAKKNFLKRYNNILNNKRQGAKKKRGCFINN